MALIKCPECGREISDKAMACPHCGAPISEMSKVSVRFFRKKSFVGNANSGPIFVDGNLIGTASSGCDYTIQLSPGQHSVSIENSGMHMLSKRSNASTITIPNDARSVEVEIVTKNSFGSFVSGGMEVTIGDVTVRR